jgi:hypothetical protein
MARKNHEKPNLPKPGDVQLVNWLPRDIRLGSDDQKGTMLYGWCETTETRQLWEVVEGGHSAKAKFVGFVVNEA